MTAASINLSVQNEDGIAEATPPVRPDIRRSLSPILDFGARRNFCNILECHYCKPLAENHRLSPLRSPIMSPSSRFSFLGQTSLCIFRYQMTLAQGTTGYIRILLQYVVMARVVLKDFFLWYALVNPSR